MASGSQRLVVTSLTSGTMVDAATDSDLTFDASTNTLNVDNLIVAGNLTVDGDQTILNVTQLEVEDINIGIASASSKLNNAQLKMVLVLPSTEVKEIRLLLGIIQTPD